MERLFDLGKLKTRINNSLFDIVSTVTLVFVVVTFAYVLVMTIMAL